MSKIDFFCFILFKYRFLTKCKMTDSRILLTNCYTRHVKLQSYFSFGPAVSVAGLRVAVV